MTAPGVPSRHVMPWHGRPRGAVALLSCRPAWSLVWRPVGRLCADHRRRRPAPGAPTCGRAGPRHTADGVGLARAARCRPRLSRRSRRRPLACRVSPPTRLAELAPGPCGRRRPWCHPQPRQPPASRRPRSRRPRPFPSPVALTATGAIARSPDGRRSRAERSAQRPQRASPGVSAGPEGAAAPARRRADRRHDPSARARPGTHDGQEARRRGPGRRAAGRRRDMAGHGRERRPSLRARPSATTPSSPSPASRKTFIAALILQLAEEGRLDLDAPYGRYVSAGPRRERVTIRQLLSHTQRHLRLLREPALPARISTAWLRTRPQPGLLLAGARWTFDEIMDLVKPDALLQARGAATTTPTRTTCCWAASPRPSAGRPSTSSCCARFFEPLGLEDTYYQPAEVPPADAAHGHWPAGAGYTDHTRIDRSDPSRLP